MLTVKYEVTWTRDEMSKPRTRFFDYVKEAREYAGKKFSTGAVRVTITTIETRREQLGEYVR